MFTRCTFRSRLLFYKMALQRTMSQCTITAAKPTSLVDERIDIIVSNLKAHQKITVYALLEEAPAIFMSYGHFTSDDNGEVNTSKLSSVGGTYKGCDGVGLLWSMVPTQDCPPGSRMVKKDVTQPFRVHLGVIDQFQQLHSKSQVESMSTLCGSTIERWYLSDGVARIPVRAGRLRGNLFLPKGGGRYPGVIDLFGTTGGLIEYRAALLARHGFAALALAYVGYDDLPNLLNLELDYFDEAVEWLSSHERVDSSRGLGIMGVSKGGELALHTAAYNPKIKACISINGPHFYEIGEHTYRGKHVNVLEFDPDKLEYREEGFVLKGCLLDSDYADIIPVQQIQGSVLLLQGMDDQTVGNHHADVIAKSLEEAKNCDYVVHKYPGAGHLIDPPYTPLTRACIHKMIGVSQMQGGEVAPHAAAQEHAWHATLAFLHQHLSPAHAKL